MTAETLLQGSPTRVFVELSKVKESNEKLKDRGSGAAKRFLRRQVSLCYPHLCNPKTRVVLSSFDSVNIRRSNELNQSWPLVASFGRRSKSCHVRPRKAASCTPRRSRGEASATSQLPVRTSCKLGCVVPVENNSQSLRYSWCHDRRTEDGGQPCCASDSSAPIFGAAGPRNARPHSAGKET